jgi:hypothetical protein
MRLAAELVIPLLALGTLAWPLCVRRPRPWWRFWVPVLAGLGLVYAVLGLDRAFGLWAGAGLDYSTHTAFAVVLAVSLFAVDRRTAWGSAALLVAYAWLMLRLGYHTLPDILTTAAVLAPLTWICHRAARARFV